MKITLRDHCLPPLNWHRFYKRDKTQCLYFITFFFNMHIFECNNSTSGKALRGHHLDRLKSLESLFSLFLALYIQLLAKSCQFYFQNVFHIYFSPIFTVKHFPPSFDYQFLYWSLQFLVLTTKIQSAQLSRYMLRSTVSTESL